MSRTTDLEKELKKSARRALTEKITASILLIVFGVILLVYTDAAVEIAVKILGAFFVISGAVLIVNFLMDRSGWRSVANVVLGTILIILGVWIFMKPQYLVAAFGIIAGAIIAANGVIDIKDTITIVKKGNKKSFMDRMMESAYGQSGEAEHADGMSKYSSTKLKNYSSPSSWRWRSRWD